MSKYRTTYKEQFEKQSLIEEIPKIFEGPREYHPNLQHELNTVTSNRNLWWKDTFGNRRFSSSDKIIYDLDGNVRKAEMLITQFGMDEISTQPGFLRDLNLLLSAISRVLKPKMLITTVVEYTLKNGRKIEEMQEGKGGQAYRYLYTTNKGVYVVKSHAPTDKYIGSVKQLYTDELLQSQEIQKAFNDKLAKLNIVFPPFVFATSEVSCRPYIYGNTPTEDQISNASLEQLSQEVQAYINSSQDPLWEKVQVDMHGYENAIRRDNFVWGKLNPTNIEESEKIYWIDPFYRPSEEGNLIQ